MINAQVGERIIGDGHEPFFVAELGICHGGDVDVALELVQCAAEAGAHCVKTEMFNHSAMVADPGAKAVYYINGERIEEPLDEHMRRFELSRDEHHRIRNRCAELGMPFMATAHDIGTIRFLKEIGAQCIKIASPDLVHVPLLRESARSGLTVFLDTGSALQHEVDIAVRELRQNGCDGVVVNHNPDGHPARPDGHHLNTIRRLKEVLEAPVGLADHYEGYEMLYAAVACGANTVEKPISMDRFFPEPERNWSISAPDLKKVVGLIRDVHLALGRASRILSRQQIEYRDRNRTACVAATDLTAGTVLDLDNVGFARPRKGIPVEHWDLVAGRTLKAAKSAMEFIDWKDLC